MSLISSLKMTDLKQLLQERELPTGGTKAELVKRLTEAEGSDKIEFESDDNVRTQIGELRDMIQNMMYAMQQVTPKVQSLPNVETVRDEQNNVETESINSATNRNIRTRNVNSIREIADTLPEYDPAKDSIFSVEQFIDRVEKSMEAYDWDEKCVLLAVYGKLKGHAKLWLDSSAEIFICWDDFSSELKGEFGTMPDEADIHYKISNAKRQHGETIIEYCFRMSALARRYNVSESAIIKYTREGMKHRDLQMAIAPLRFKSMREMRVALEEYLSNVASCSSSNKAYPSSKRDYSDSGDKSANKNTNDNTRKPETDRKPLVCYNCSEVGHMSNACPKPQRRARCKDCHRVHPKGSPENCGKKISSITSSVRKDFNDKRVMINGEEFYALIDTGSQCSMVRRTKAEKLKGDRKICSLRISGVCGGSRVLTEAMDVKMVIDDIDFSIVLYVADDDVFASDLIIGNDIFDKNNVRLVVDENDQRFECLTVAQTTISVNNINVEKEIEHGEISVSEKIELSEIVNEYRDVFGVEISEIGLTNAMRMKIELMTTEPIVSKPYRLPEPKKVAVSEMINELLANDIIRKSTSEYASPIVLVKKKNGNDRLCIDYRRINQHMVKEIFPTPNIEERLQEVLKFKIFTVLDLNSGYYQILIEESCRKYTAFVTPDGLYEFKRMPFGLKNAPAVFQRLMALIREKAEKGDVIHYMDDIVIGADSVDDMFQKIKRVFGVLRELNLTINIRKCSFVKESVEFLGHKIHPAGMSPGRVKTAAILEFATPKSITEVRQFLGLSGYFRKFVPGYALISQPLRFLLRKDVKFYWHDEQETALQQLKTYLTTSPVLVGYISNAEHQIHTDASSVGLAGVLLQEEDGIWKPVAYYSRSTTTDEKKFHSYELETLAVVETLERFRYYVYGKQFTVVTDCSAIRTTMQKKELVPRIARWWLRIQDFDVKIEHRSGQRMLHVDALSRAPYEDSHEMETASLRVAKTNVSNNDWLFSMQLQDDKIRDIVDKVTSCNPEICKDFVIENGRLFRKVKNDNLWVVPKALRCKIIQGQHDNTGHLGLEKTIDGLQKHFWFPRMRNAVKSHIKSCLECAYNKSAGGKREGEYHYDNANPVPFHTVHVDHLGPFPRSTKRNEHILVIVDAFTKFTIIRAVKSTATKHVITILNEVTEYFGMPTRMITDRGTAFTSHAFERFCKENDVKHILNAVRTPRANAHAERTNRTILGMLLPTTETDKRWDDQLRRIQWSLNTMRNKTTNKTPQELLFGFQPRDILQNKLVLALHHSELYDQETLMKLRDEAAERIDKQREYAKQRYDDKHSTPRRYTVGDLVLAENEPTSTGASRKLEPLYKGPFIIKEVLDKDRYVIEDLPGSTRTQRHYTSVYASDKIKPWCALPSIEDSASDDTDVDDEQDSNRGRLICRDGRL